MKNQNEPSIAITRARELAPFIEANARRAENEFTYPTDVIKKIRELKLNSSFLPQDVGEVFLSITQMVDLWEEQASQDGSYGWLSIANGLASANCAAYLPDEGFRNVFGETLDVCIAGQYFANGRGTAVEGGYLIEGRWQFGSGISHSDWVVAGFVIMRDGRVDKMPNGVPNILVAVIPKQHVTIHRNWHVMGLKGTGSFDYSITNYFVPYHMTFPLYTQEKRRGDAKFDLGIMPIAAVSHGSWALGIAKRMLLEIQQLAIKKVRAGEANALATKVTFQKDFSTAAAKLQSAKLFLIDSLENAVIALDGALSEGELHQYQATVRLSACYATNVAVDICNFAHTAAGTIAVQEHYIMERFFRDMHTGKQHFVVSERAQTDAAEELLGLRKRNRRSD